MASKNKKYKFAHIDLRKKIKDQDEVPTPQRDSQEEAPISNSELEINTNKSAIEVDDIDVEPSANSNKVIALIAIIAGILVMIAGFTIYQYFNQVGNIGNEASSTANVSKTPLQLDPKTSNKPLFAGDFEGIIPGKSLEDIKIDSKSQKSDPGEIIASAPDIINNTTPTSSSWHANNYNYEDIQKGKYIVKFGDTLWEIAEGVYGNGAEWIQIAQSNDIAYFSNGRPLIHSGQILNIP